MTITIAAAAKAASPFRIAIVGAGPSGFYAAEALLRAPINIQIDMFERLPVPYGLVRFGVAPDHPKLKQVTAVFDRIASMPGFRFVGGIDVGIDVTIDTLFDCYHAVILATGAALGRKMGIPGESLPGSHQASDFIGWYNGHPDYRDCCFDLSGERAVIVGHGNVALDIARILLKTTDELRHSDIAAHALEALDESKIREVQVVGRRGLLETRFSAKELQEFSTLSDCDPVLDPDDPVPDVAALPDGTDAEKRAAVSMLASFSTQISDRKRRCVFRFHLQPHAIEGRDRVERMVFSRGSSLSGDRSMPVSIDCGLVFSSIGRRSAPVPGVAYDEVRGVHANVAGRGPHQATYVCGWSKRGPQGTIGANRACAVETVQHVLADLSSNGHRVLADADALIGRLASKHGVHIDFASWQAIDAAELEQGRLAGKPREKFLSVDQMIAVVTKRRTAC
ncbi:FAD-dependent oxidoreductase (plasmid) [Agrobacterium vitis]|uniref:FAD-dependent oxidoreductase n=1 Tax=Agrobacterium vitis TaxID=373 RepID=UPI003D2B0E12